MQAKIRMGNYSNCVLNVLLVNMSLLLPLVLDVTSEWECHWQDRLADLG